MPARPETAILRSVGTLIRRRVIVHGRVQGVWFRESTRQAAEEAGVAGWVRNLHDGTVEAVFEGDGTAVRKLVGWCGVGPSGATVEQVVELEERPEGLNGFEVRLTPPP